MHLFRRGQSPPAQPDPEIVHLAARVSALESAHRQLEGEQALMHDQVRKWMRRAVRAEQNQERDGETELLPTPAADATPAPPSRRAAWGARGRRVQRLAVTTEESNGVHS